MCSAYEKYVLFLSFSHPKLSLLGVELNKLLYEGQAVELAVFQVLYCLVTSLSVNIIEALSLYNWSAFLKAYVCPIIMHVLHIFSHWCRYFVF